MGFLSFALVALFFTQLPATLAQGSATKVPAITGPENTPAAQCGGCYVVADVAGIFFGNVTYTQTQTEVVSIGITPNGTNLTSTTTITAGITPFTVYPSGLATPGLLSLNFRGPTITLGGVVLTSPTAYDVFTAYSLTSTITSSGKCVVVQNPPIILDTAFSIPRPPGAGADFDRTAEELFIASANIVPTCKIGGVNSIPTTAAPATAVTATSTIVGPVRPTLSAQPIQTPAFTTVTSTVIRTTSRFKSTSTATIVIVPIVTPLSLPIVSPTSLSTSTLSSSSSSTLTSSTSPPSTTFSSSSSSTTSSGSSIVILPLAPISSPSITASASSPILPQASTTKTSVVSQGTIIIVSNSTFLQTGSGPGATIIPFKGDASHVRMDLKTSWLLWGSGIFGTLMASCAL